MPNGSGWKRRYEDVVKPPTMRYYCHFCHKSVSSELPANSVIRAILICPECIEAGKIIFPEVDEE